MPRPLGAHRAGGIEGKRLDIDNGGSLDVYHLLKNEFSKLAHDMLDEPVSIVSARALSAKEAIGEPDRDDYPLLKGKEVMIEAQFKGSRGQAFTDTPGTFEGSIRDIIALPLTNNFQRAVFIASLNAFMRELGHISGTLHCRDKEPEQCAREFVQHVRERFGNPRVSFVGFQPAMIERFSEQFEMRVLDLDEDNIGKTKFGLTIEGPDNTEEVLRWGDIILATGSTCINGTIEQYLGEKPVIFYGVSASAATKICGLERFCRYPH